MTDAQLVQDYLANGGTITQCPPRTYSHSEIVSWREQHGEEWRKRMARNSPFAASRNSIPAGDLFRLIGLHGVAGAAGVTGLAIKTIRTRMNNAGLNEAFLKSQDWDA